MPPDLEVDSSHGVRKEADSTIEPIGVFGPHERGEGHRGCWGGRVCSTGT